MKTFSLIDKNKNKLLAYIGLPYELCEKELIEYKANGYLISNQLGFNNLITGYFKDIEKLKECINKKYHKQIN